jgi:hypothetical protein
VTPAVRLLWFTVHVAGIVVGIWAGVQLVRWAL